MINDDLIRKIKRDMIRRKERRERGDRRKEGTAATTTTTIEGRGGEGWGKERRE